MYDSPFFFIKNQISLFNNFFHRADPYMVGNVVVRRKFQNNQITLFAGIDAADFVRPIKGRGGVMVKALSASSVEMFI